MYIGKIEKFINQPTEIHFLEPIFEHCAEEFPVKTGFKSIQEFDRLFSISELEKGNNFYVKQRNKTQISLEYKKNNMQL